MNAADEERTTAQQTGGQLGQRDNLHARTDARCTERQCEPAAATPERQQRLKRVLRKEEYKRETLRNILDHYCLVLVKYTRNI